MGYLLGARDARKSSITSAAWSRMKSARATTSRAGWLFYDVLRTLFPDGHPYQHEAIGSMADLDSASMEDVRQWFRDNYGPNNATLVLAGDISPAEARPLVAKYFGAIAARPRVNNPAEATVPTLAEDVRKVFKDQVATTRITKYWPVEGLNGKDRIAL